MKTSNWCVSANWGLYNHIIRSDCASYREAIRVAEGYLERYIKMRNRRPGRSKSHLPAVHIWRLHESI